MRIYPILSVVYMILLLVHLTDEPINWWAMAVSLGIAMAMVLMWIWLRSNIRKRHETLMWLNEHKELISGAPQYFHSSPFPAKPITVSTKLRDFKVVTSAIIVTIMHNTGSDLRSPIIRGAIATLWTLIFGWWGLPWGPIRTIQALAINLSGGEITPVGKAMLTASTAIQIESNG